MLMAFGIFDGLLIFSVSFQAHFLKKSRRYIGFYYLSALNFIAMAFLVVWTILRCLQK